MLEKIIKERHNKIIWSYYGILGMVTVILPLGLLGIGIYFQVSKVNEFGILWMVLGAVAFLFSLRRVKDFFPIYKYAINPKKFPAYQKLLEDGIDPSQFDEELKEANLKETLTKNNPLVLTEHFIFGFSQVSFFFLCKENVLWVYEYNGNGLVIYDSHKIYGFTYFQTVDGNTEAVNLLKHEMPYIYFGTDFDYKTVMHEQFDETVEFVKQEREKFLAHPDEYREEKERAEKEKIEEETRRLEEERQKQMSLIGENQENDASDVAEETIENSIEEKEETSKDDKEDVI